MNSQVNTLLTSVTKIILDSVEAELLSVEDSQQISRWVLQISPKTVEEIPDFIKILKHEYQIFSNLEAPTYQDAKQPSMTAENVNHELEQLRIQIANLQNQK